MLGLRLRHQGAFSCWPRAGALYQMDELPRGPGLSWTSGRDIRAREAAPSAQPSGFTSLGAGGHNRVTSFLAWESALGGWGRAARSTSFLERGVIDQGLGQARPAGPLETRNQTAEDGDFASPRPPSVFVSLTPSWLEIRVSPRPVLPPPPAP